MMGTPALSRPATTSRTCSTVNWWLTVWLPSLSVTSVKTTCRVGCTRLTPLAASLTAFNRGLPFRRPADGAPGRPPETDLTCQIKPFYRRQAIPSCPSQTGFPLEKAGGRDILGWELMLSLLRIRFLRSGGPGLLG